MNETLEIITQYGTAFSAIAAVIAFTWSVVQFVLVRASEARFRQFETFHKLIKELTEPNTTNNYRQLAVLFELRFYPRYYPITLRILKSTIEHEVRLPNTSSEMIEEVNMLISFIERRCSNPKLKRDCAKAYSPLTPR